MDLSIFGELKNGVLILHPVLTVKQFDHKSFPTKITFSSLEIDGRNVKQCDSVGIAALIWLVERARAEKKSLVWQNLPPTITHLLELYELDLTGLLQYSAQKSL